MNNDSLISFLIKLHLALDVSDEVQAVRDENPELDETALVEKAGPIVVMQHQLCKALLTYAMVLKNPNIPPSGLEEMEDVVVTPLAELIQKGLLFIRREGVIPMEQEDK